MTTVLKKLLHSDGQNIDCPDTITSHHHADIRANKLRHYFLGGLLHINGIQIDGSLGSILRDLVDSGANNLSTYIATINAETNGMEESIGQTADQMHNLKNEPMTIQGREASQLILGDDELLDSWTKMDATARHNAMNKHFAQIILTGYSYGTSLIQQMESDIIKRLRARKLSIKPLLNVRVLNIGPVDMPHCDKGFKADFNHIANGFEGKRSGFRQLFALKVIDKIMDSVIARRLVPANDGALLQEYGSSRIRYYVDYASDADIKRIGVTRFAEGREVARLNVNYDPEAHDLRLYLNRKRIVSANGGSFMTFSSSPLSSVLRQAMAQAIVGNLSFNQQDCTSAVASYVKEKESFTQIRQDYEQAGFNQSLAMVKHMLSVYDHPLKPELK
ncbi:MAG: hypothetical protein VX740_11150 [Pseudomonadota bacterium]|nr:hypothetical protein [Pseudomonadota bacterium]